MAGLGIGAGAFEGDNARKEQQQRDAQLGLQAASLQQQGRQADMADSRARMGMAIDQQNRKAELAFGQQRLGEEARRFDTNTWLTQQQQAEQRRQFDTGIGMRDKELQRADRMDAFNQEQTLRKNDWEDVLNSEKIRTGELQYQELLKLRDEEDRQRTERDSVAKSAIGQMIKIAYTNGGAKGQNFLSKSQVEYFRGVDPRFAGLQTGTWADDGQGGKILQLVMQGPDGQPVQETIDQKQQYLAISSLWGQKYADGMFAREDKQAYNSYLTNRGEKTMSKLDEIRYKTADEILTKNESDTATMQKALKDMQDIESFYGRGIQRQQEPPLPVQEKPSPERSVIHGAQQRTSQPQMNKTTSSIRSILTTVVPESERQQILSEIDAFDPTGERQEEVLASLQKRYAGQSKASPTVSESPSPRNEAKRTVSNLPPPEELEKYGITPVYGGKVYAFKAGLLSPKTYINPEQVMAEYKRLKDAETAKANSPEERKRAEDRRKRAEYERMFGKGFGYGS